MSEAARGRRGLARAVLAILLIASQQVFAQPLPNQNFESDWEARQAERNWREGDYALPAFPVQKNLIEFPVSAASSFRFFVDATSLSVGKDRVVRYTLVARSGAGAENISFEGIRCATAMYRIYATGHADGTWSSRPTDWRTIDPKGVARWHLALRREFFCPKDMTIHDAAEGVDALRNGRHPDAMVGQFR